MSKKGEINTRLKITKNNFQQVLPHLTLELKRVIDKLPKDQKNNKELLRQGLKELGWTEKEINFFSKVKSSHSSMRKSNPKKEISPSFKYLKNKVGLSKNTPKPFQGGSPGLGKGKS